MPLTASEVAAFKATDKRQKKSCGDSLVLVVEPISKGGGKSFTGVTRFPPRSPKNGGKRVEESIEKCASIYPVEGTFSYFFSCNRGLNGGKGNQECSSTMRFSTLLKKWNPPLFRKYVREKEMAKRNYRIKFADQG